jgi:hypothetical protein
MLKNLSRLEKLNLVIITLCVGLSIGVAALVPEIAKTTKAIEELQEVVRSSPKSYRIDIVEFAKDSISMSFSNHIETVNLEEAKKHFKTQCFTTCDEMDCPDSTIIMLIEETPYSQRIIVDSILYQ